jgi:hypothetical protein
LEKDEQPAAAVTPQLDTISQFEPFSAYEPNNDPVNLETSEPGQGKLYAMVAGAAALLIVVIGGAYMLLSGGSSGQTPPPAALAETEQPAIPDARPASSATEGDEEIGNSRSETADAQGQEPEQTDAPAQARTNDQQRRPSGQPTPAAQQKPTTEAARTPTAQTKPTPRRVTVDDLINDH